MSPIVLLEPKFKAVMEAFPDCGLNALAFCNFMAQPDKKLNPYLEIREDEKERVLKEKFPGKYSSASPSVKAAIKEMKEVLFELPEDRMYRSAKMMFERVEKDLETTKPKDLKEMKTAMEILKQVEAVTLSLGKTREARETARTKSNQTVRGGVKMAYDQRPN